MYFRQSLIINFITSSSVGSVLKILFLRDWSQLFSFTETKYAIYLSTVSTNNIYILKIKDRIPFLEFVLKCKLKCSLYASS